MTTSIVLASGTDHQALTAESRIIIPDYLARVSAYYGVPEAALEGPGMFREFGIGLRFQEPTLFSIYNREWELLPAIKSLVKTYGVVLIENAYLGLQERNEGQKNIFPDLAFHLDRGPGFKNQYSLFVRDPYDPEQKYPRKSSTLVIPYKTTFLQAEREYESVRGNESRIDLFKQEDILPLLDNIMVHQPWTAPEGMGELCVFDNRTVYHASYYRKKIERGYQIGVRYVS